MDPEDIQGKVISLTPGQIELIRDLRVTEILLNLHSVYSNWPDFVLRRTSIIPEHECCFVCEKCDYDNKIIDRYHFTYYMGGGVDDFMSVLHEHIDLDRQAKLDQLLEALDVA